MRKKYSLLDQFFDTKSIETSEDLPSVFLFLDYQAYCLDLIYPGANPNNLDPQNFHSIKGKKIPLIRVEKIPIGNYKFNEETTKGYLQFDGNAIERKFHVPSKLKQFTKLSKSNLFSTFYFEGNIFQNHKIRIGLQQDRVKSHLKIYLHNTNFQGLNKINLTQTLLSILFNIYPSLIGIEMYISLKG